MDFDIIGALVLQSSGRRPMLSMGAQLLFPSVHNRRQTEDSRGGTKGSLEGLELGFFNLPPNDF